MFIRNSQEFGNLVKQVRNKLRLTQPEVASACGTGTRFIVNLEHGKPTCELDKALRVASMLGIKIDAVEPTQK